AQVVEQRAPKPRAVSSRLTTPAKSTVPAGAVLFCYPHAPRCPVIGWPQKEDAYGYRIPAAVAAAAGGGRRCADPADGACQRAGRQFRHHRGRSLHLLACGPALWRLFDAELCGPQPADLDRRPERLRLAT